MQRPRWRLAALLLALAPCAGARLAYSAGRARRAAPRERHTAAAAASAAGAAPVEQPAGIDVDALIRHNLALYADAVRQRTDRVRALYGGDLDAVVPAGGHHGGQRQELGRHFGGREADPVEPHAGDRRRQAVHRVVECVHRAPRSTLVLARSASKLTSPRTPTE